MSVSGHKSESFLQSYWAPNFNERQRWSNILAGEGTSNTEPPAKRARVVESDVTRDEGDMRNVFHGCTISGTTPLNRYFIGDKVLPLVPYCLITLFCTVQDHTMFLWQKVYFVADGYTVLAYVTTSKHISNDACIQCDKIRKGFI